MKARWWSVPAVMGGIAAGREIRAFRARELVRTDNEKVRAAAVGAVRHDDAPAGDHVAIVMPAFNEADGLAEVLGALPNTVCGLPVRVVVVDDGSEDGTPAVAARESATVVVHAQNLGQGDAIRTGLSVALDGGATIIVTMDADGQHRADELEGLIRPVLDDHADYVQGSRFLGSYDDAGGARDAGIRWFTRLINAVGGTEITDCTNGFRAIRASGVAAMSLHEDRFSAPEIILEAKHRGLRMMECPVHIQSREHGESKKPRRLGYPLGFARAIFEVRVRQAFVR